jgi:hypothetical protein
MTYVPAHSTAPGGSFVLSYFPFRQHTSASFLIVLETYVGLQRALVPSTFRCIRSSSGDISLCTQVIVVTLFAKSFLSVVRAYLCVQSYYNMLENAMHVSLRTVITTTVSIPDCPVGTYRRGPCKNLSVYCGRKSCRCSNTLESNACIQKTMLQVMLHNGHENNSIDT